MDETVIAQPLPDPAACRAELETVLASQTFGRAPAVSKILRFVCSRYLEGVGDTVTEWTIAIDGLGRRENFDPERDAIVRVEFHLLRKRLTQYYLKEGASHGVRITFGENGYLPRFVLAGAVAPEVPALPPPTPEPEPEAIPVAAPAPAQEVPELPRRWRAGTVLGIAAALTGVFLIAVWALEQRPAELASKAAPPVFTGRAIRIATGITAPKYLDSSGNSWSGDAFATGGTLFDLPDRKIFRTLNQDLYQHGREGEFRYDIPAGAGWYELHLHFAETRFGQSPLEGAEGARKFDVALNGRPLLTDFDIARDAAGANTATVKVWKDVAPAADGQFHFAFTGRAGMPLLNGIELLPAKKGEPLPVRISCGPRAVSDKQGRLWQADEYFLGGRQFGRDGEVTGTDDDSIFASSRLGNFSYAIPVADGLTYKGTLHFFEGVHRSEGERVFDVYANGVELLRDFDIIGKAGGPRRAATATFRNLRPNAQGKLIFSFVPGRDDAAVSAIEVEAER
ncbi:MAG: malectin domain-containing carbohydrate-binding protein [Candidatus Solibacter sp.]